VELVAEGPTRIISEVTPVDRRYRVVRRRLAEMGTLLDVLTQETAALFSDDKSLTSLDRYAFGDLLGQGGMSRVYRAVDRESGREVVIKVLTDRGAADATAASHFMNEGRLLSRLQHPRLVRLLAEGSANGQPYLVMEFIDGVTVSQAVHDLGRLSPETAAAIAASIAEPLEYIHDQGIARVDLKPANVLLTTDRGAFLIDLGTATPISTPSRSGNPDEGEVVPLMGTQQYMAPEQFQESLVDPRSDIYSWGVLLFEMVTGAQPFSADDVLGSRNRPLVLPSGVVSSLTDLDELIRRCLATTVAERPASFRDATALLTQGFPAIENETVIADVIGSLVGQIRSRRNVDRDETELMMVGEFPPQVRRDNIVPDLSNLPGYGNDIPPTSPIPISPNPTSPIHWAGARKATSP